MIIPKPKFHRLAQEAVDQLAREGIVCTPDEILWLQYMAEKASRPARSDELLFLDLPVPCGNVLLWPISIGARIWLAQYGKPWFAGTGDLEELVFAFAMAHSRDPEVFAGLNSCLKARMKVALWARKIKATRRELNEAISRCLTPEDSDLIEVEGPKPKNPTASASDYGDCLALLCYFYGESPSHWLWKIGEDECADLLNKIAGVLPADKRVDSADAKFIALSKFRLVVNHIRKLRNESDSTDQPEGNK